MSDHWLDLEEGLPLFNALSWRTVYRRLWAGKRYALIIIKRVEKKRRVTTPYDDEAIEAFASTRGLNVEIAEAELDVTGSKLVRPILDEIMQAIESGRSEGIIVATVDRLSRAGLGDAIKLVEKVIRLGGKLGFADLDIDPSTKEGEYMLNSWLGMAHMQWRGYQEKWATAQKHAMARGARIGCALPGYDKGEDGKLVLNDDAPMMEKAFRLAGSSGVPAAMNLLAEALPDRVWTVSTTRRLLGSKVYRGELHYGSICNAEAHEPLVSLAVWTAAQRSAADKKASANFPLSGIPICNGCGRPMVGSRSSGVRTYRCKYGKECSKPAVITAAKLEEYATTKLSHQWAQSDWQVSDSSVGPTDDAQRQLDDAEYELTAFASDQTLRKALGSRYQEQLQARVDTQEAALKAFQAQAKASTCDTRVTPERLLDEKGLRDVIGSVASISVERGRAPVAERVTMKFVGSWLGRQVEDALQQLA